MNSTASISVRGVLNRLAESLNKEDKREVIPLAHGDPSAFPCFRTTPVADEAIFDAVRSAKNNHYAPTVGLLPARRAAADYLNRGLPYKLSPDDVFLTLGCIQAIEIAVAVLAAIPGANVLLPRPCFPYYEARAAHSCLDVRHFDLLPEKGWEVDLEAVEALADENTVAMVIINPGNPCGSVYSYQHLEKSVADHLNRDLPYKLSPDDVFLTLGCTQAIEITITVLARPGANILLPRPGFPYYEARAAHSHLEARHFDLIPEKGWEVDLDAVEALADENTVAMVVINPGNPCGSVYSYQHLQKIAETARKLGIMVIADEVYGHLTFGNSPFVPMGVFGSIVPVLTLGSISKRWIVPGWRIGWLVASDPNGILQESGVVESIKGCLNISSDPVTFIQGAIPQIIDNTTADFFTKINNILREAADICYEKIQDIPCITLPHKPEGSMFVMVKLNLSSLEGIGDDMDFCLKLAKEESVMILPAEYLSADLPYNLSADDIYLTVGCTQSIEVILSVLARPGANILLPRPGYPLYESRAGFSKLEVRHFDLIPEKSWEVDLESVEALADENTAAIVIISPGNPCGNVFSYQHLKKVAETARKLGIFVIADEVYGHIAFGSNPYVPMGEFGSIVPVLSLGSISKRWIVPGWRFGWIATCDPNGILEKYGIVDSIKSYFNISSNPATFVQAAIPQIFEKTKEDFFSKTINIMREAADICYEKTKEIPCVTCPHKPDGSMFAMVKLNLSLLEDISDDMDFCLKLAREESVTILPGVAVGLKNWLRITFSIEPQSLEQGLDRMKAFCQRHSRK
ncbi:hypothetical protein NC651_036233 [Populus alba x Populus x berolinensis]|nr:hypothetical protein NC651_036233 [Populus alba x Populus x berolinensis]